MGLIWMSDHVSPPLSQVLNVGVGQINAPNCPNKCHSVESQYADKSIDTCQQARLFLPTLQNDIYLNHVQGKVENTIKYLKWRRSLKRGGLAPHSKGSADSRTGFK
jgi:hypothetical protein